MAGDDGFLARWSRRKAGAKGSAPSAEAVDPPARAATPAGMAATSPAPMVGELPAQPAPREAEAAVVPAPLPTLDDVAKLTHASDFSPYVARNVDAGVRNAAMKKLFSDPHFNVMDGLDTYIDDYGKPDPIPLSMLRRMNQSVALGLFSDEAEAIVPTDTSAAPAAKACPDGAAPDPVAESALPAPEPTAAEPRADDDPDLQLQPDDAGRRAGAGPGPRD